MFLAGSKTVQITTTNLITNLIHHPEVYQKLRAEIDPYMATVKDDIMNKMTLEGVDELPYTKMCFQESMRMDSPAGMSSTSCMSKDLNISGVDMRKGEPFYIMIQNIQNDPT